MKNSSKVYMQKVCANNRIYALFYYKESCHIIGVCENKKMNIIERAPHKKRKIMLEYAYKECLIDKYAKPTNNIRGDISIRMIKFKENEKVLILKGRTVVAIYQYGVDFIEGLSIEIKKEVLFQLYQFGYINADIYAKIVNKLEIK